MLSDIMNVTIVETPWRAGPSEPCRCGVCGSSPSARCEECGGNLGGHGDPARCSSERTLGIASGHSHPRCQARVEERERGEVQAYIHRLWRQARDQGLRGKAIEAMMLELCPGLELLRQRYRLG